MIVCNLFDFVVLYNKWVYHLCMLYILFAYSYVFIISVLYSSMYIVSYVVNFVSIAICSCMEEWCCQILELNKNQSIINQVRNFVALFKFCKLSVRENNF